MEALKQSGADPTIVYVLSALLPSIGLIVVAIVGWLNRKDIVRVRRTTEETARRGREERLAREQHNGGADDRPTPCP